VALSIEGKNALAITLVTKSFKHCRQHFYQKRINYNEVDIVERLYITEWNYYTADKNGVHMATLLVLESLIRRDAADYVLIQL
jgi:hypothetical protein